MKPIRLSDKAAFSTQRFLPQLLHGSGNVRALLLCLEPGQCLPPRADAEEMICYIISGQALLTIADSVTDVTAGDFAAAAPGDVRGIEATERLTALWIHLSSHPQTPSEGSQCCSTPDPTTSETPASGTANRDD